MTFSYYLFNSKNMSTIYFAPKILDLLVLLTNPTNLSLRLTILSVGSAILHEPLSMVLLSLSFFCQMEAKAHYLPISIRPEESKLTL